MEDFEISARNLVLCRHVKYDADNREAPYSLQNVLSTVRAVEVESLKQSKPICLYAEYFGPAGEYEVWIDLVSLGYDDYGDEIEVTNFGPFALTLSEGKFVHQRYYYLQHVPLFSSGLYEFQVRIAGLYQVVISQTLHVED